MKVSWLASPPPDAAIEIAADAVSAAAVTPRHGQLVVEAYATERLEPGIVTPSMTSRNVADPEALAGAVAKVVERLGTRPSRVALVVPDLAGRVSLVRFDQVPSRADDLDQLVRWQLKKSSPFSVDDAVVSCSPPVPQAGGGHELVVVSARRDVIREYETACEAASLDPGLVDLSTLSILNLFLADGTGGGRDWLLVHMQPQYTSLAIVRGEHLIFYRNRPEDDEASLADVVHQTTMYYQDRLEGQGFARVLLGGIGRVDGAPETARRSLEERLGVSVEPIDPTREASLTDRISTNADLLAALAPLVGILVRTRREAVAA
jgi:type IV pilus assembly protein PilM